MLIAVLLMTFTFSYAEEVSIPAIWNKQMISAELYTTYSEDFYQYDNSRFSFHAFVPACVTSAKLPMNGDGVSIQLSFLFQVDIIPSMLTLSGTIT